MVRGEMIPFSVVSYIMGPDMAESAYFWSVSTKKYESNDDTGPLSRLSTNILKSKI